jgi:hypothetical protein
MFPIGFRPKPAEFRAIERACRELGCSRSDLLRLSVRETLQALRQQGFTTATTTKPLARV